MQAGKLRHRIELQRNTPGQNSLAEATDDWTTYDKVYAAVEPLTGREYFQSQQTVSDVSMRVTIRWRAGVLPKHRVKFGSRILDIESVINVEERNREMQLMCREAV